MSGYTKHICEKETAEAQKQINQFIESLIPILPYKYDFNTINSLLKDYYPYEIFLISEKYKYYQIKEKSLSSKNIKSRYHYKDVDDYVRSSNILIKILNISFVKSHQEVFNQNEYENTVQQFKIQRNPRILKQYKKIQTAIKQTQQLEPSYLDSLIGLYSRKRTTQKDKVYILKELKKYYCPKIIAFFSKLIDTEYNRQLREEAFYHLQSFGYQPNLPRQKYIRIPSKNRKRREFLKEYANETFKVEETPAELEYRINNSKDQKIKEYDFFISHSSIDYNSIQLLIESLNKQGNNIYCDWINDSDYLKRHLAGHQTLNVIKKRLDQSKRMIFVLSSNSIESKWCKYEINYFIERNKEILFIRKEDISNGAFQYSPYDVKNLINSNYNDSIEGMFKPIT